MMPSSGVIGGWRLLVVPLPGTTLRRIPTANLWAMHSLAQDRPGHPAPLAFAGAVDLAAQAIGDWVEPGGSYHLLVDGRLGAVLEAYVDRLLRAIDRRVCDAESSHLATIEDRKRANAAMVGSAARHSRRVLGVGAHQVRPAEKSMIEADPLARAAAVLRAVVGRDHELVREPVDRDRALRDDRDAILVVARSSGLHTYEVALPDGWLRRDFGPLVVWQPIGVATDLDRTAEPPVRAVAVVFRRGRYHRVDSETSAVTPVSAAAAAELTGQALTVQVPMSPDGRLRGLLRAGVRGARRDARGVVFAAALVACLGLAAPMVTSAVLGQVAVTGEVTRLVDVSALFVGTALVAAMVAVMKNLLLLRLEGRVQRDTQLAVWDRLMRLPVRFFTIRTSGELASIVLSPTLIGDAVGGLLAQVLSAILVTVVVLTMLASVDLAVAGVAIGLVVVTAAATAALGVVVVRRQRQALPREHRLAAVTNEMIDGIVKIKLAAAEDRAYARWAITNSSAELAAQRVKSVQGLLTATFTALPTAAQLALLAMLTGPLAGRLQPAEFFLVNSGFLILVGMLLTLVNAGVTAMVILPRIEDLSLLADSKPEQRTGHVDPGELGGDIELVDVSFGYAPDGPLVLRGLSLHIEPGQFVAIVGPSGCGKSTLLRLLLGFEQPRTGSVRYDRQDLNELDVAAVRRQCGVVLQNGQLFAGSIRENIAGASSYPLEQLWEAARTAGVDSDIADLPMGMSTLLPSGGGTLSVGQRQRLLVARALVGRPRMMFLDEATSALDNRTQQIVTSSLQRLAATRVVIAHRLSTVADADVIIVLDQGRVVQAGRYEALMADTNGLFAELARRQLLDAT